MQDHSTSTLSPLSHRLQQEIADLRQEIEDLRRVPPRRESTELEQENARLRAELTSIAHDANGIWYAARKALLPAGDDEGHRELLDGVDYVQNDGNWIREVAR